MPESVSVVQTHSNRIENNDVHNSHVISVIIPKIVILKPHILYDLDRQPSENQKLRKETLILPRTKSSRKLYNGFLWSHSKRLFSEQQQRQKSWPSFALILLSLFC